MIQLQINGNLSSQNQSLGGTQLVFIVTKHSSVEATALQGLKSTPSHPPLDVAIQEKASTLNLSQGFLLRLAAMQSWVG